VLPRGGVERLLLLVGTLALAGVAFMAVRGWHRYERGGATTTHTETVAERQTREGRVRRPAQALVIRAERGASWLLVRSGTTGGRLLYEGTLGAGRVLRFPGRRFWLRAGAASNLEAAWAGRPVRDFPRGTATIAIADGVARATG
jgi:hypothetical protein